MSSKGNVLHNERKNNLDCNGNLMPDWISVRAPYGFGFAETFSVDLESKLITVCAKDAYESFSSEVKRKNAAFMIMGDTCTRACSFCSVTIGTPSCLDESEPDRLAKAAQEMDLDHIIVTSVDRDDLQDGGANHYVQVIKKLRERIPECIIEVLTPDFSNKKGSAQLLANAHPNLFSHNMETIARLYSTIRVDANYLTSLCLLKDIKIYNPSIYTKSSLMVGLGETTDEIYHVMDDLRSANVDFLAIGQYFQPSPKHAMLDRYVTPEEFISYEEAAKERGFLSVSSSPFARSTYNKDGIYQRLKGNGS